MRRRDFGGAALAVATVWSRMTVMSHHMYGSVSPPPARGGRRGCDSDRSGLPALEPELLGLLLDVLVVERGAVGRRADPRADLDRDLLERRALHRRRELQRRRDLLLTDVLLQVGDRRGHLRGQVAALHHERAGHVPRLGVDVTALGARDERLELLGRVELLALRGL